MCANKSTREREREGELKRWNVQESVELMMYVRRIITCPYLAHRVKTTIVLCVCVTEMQIRKLRACVIGVRKWEREKRTNYDALLRHLTGASERGKSKDELV